jgi:hypothetical protein
MPAFVPLIIALMGAAFAVGLATLGMRQLRGLQADLAASRIVRTSGPISVSSWRQTHILTMSDGTISVSEGAANALASHSWATIDHSPHRLVLFEALDADGKLLYRDPRYTP